jgi:hypothetical protein
MKAERVVEVYLYSFFSLGFRWGGWITPRPGRFTYGEENWHPLYMKLGGLQGVSGRVSVTFVCRKKNTSSGLNVELRAIDIVRCERVHSQFYSAP